MAATCAVSLRPATGRERARIAAQFAHQGDAIGVGRRLGPARIGRAQHGLGGDHHRAAADEIAEHHAEQERQSRRLQHGARAVAVRDMADLVR